MRLNPHFRGALLLMAMLLPWGPLSTVHAMKVKVDPTLLPAQEAKVVTVTIDGPGRFYTGTTPPPYRVRLVREGQLLNLLTPVSLSPTRLTFLFPRMEPGFYGFVVRAQNASTGTWFDVYESSPRFFKVAADTGPVRVFQAFEPASPGLAVQPWEFIDTQEVVVHGVITGEVVVTEDFSDADQAMSWRWLKDFPKDNEDEAGLILSLDCRLQGQRTNRISVPFEMVLDIPRRMAANQTNSFTPRAFRYTDGAVVSAGHQYGYSTSQELWINVPYDLQPPFSLSLNQKTNELVLEGSVPTGFPWTAMDIGPFHVGYPFDDGEVNYPPMMVRLAGDTSFANSGGIVKEIPDGSRQLWTGERVVDGLWQISADQIVILSWVPVPVVGQVASALSAAGVSLTHDFNLDLGCADFVHLKPPYLYDFEFKAPAGAGPAVPLRRTFTFKVDGYTGAQYVYKLTTGATFDMRGIDPIPVCEAGLDDVFARMSAVFHEFTAEFTLDTTVEVLPSETYASIYAPAVTGLLNVANYLPTQADAERIRLSNITFTNPPPPVVVSSVVQGTFPVRLESEFALLVVTNSVPGGVVVASPAPNEGGYAKGTVVSLQAHPAEGHLFAGWTGDVTGLANPVHVTMDDVKVVTPRFVRAVTLRTAVVDGALVLSWDAGAGYLLEFTESLTPPVNWVPVVTGGQSTHASPMGGAAGYYRLRFAP